MRDNETGVSFDVDGETFILTYDFNALCDLEQEGIDLLEGKTKSDKLASPGYVRKLFHTGCTDAAGKPLTDLAAAGVIVGKLGLPATVGLITEAMMVPALPPSARPQKAQPSQ